MNLIIRRGRKNGIEFCKMYDTPDASVPVQSYVELSRRLTGTTCSDPLNGIFTGGQRGASNKTFRCRFTYGHVEKVFDFPIIDFEHDDVLLIEQLLKNRIQSVRNWVESVDYEEELEFCV